ncbi:MULTISPECIES: hypothetical protein [Bacillus]|uniref:hypothetical protein n=1 Tax=Bacillus TaxID=1386 RepID=UPI0012FE9210|nr:MULTISPECIES: hypothetical protein [Bacillus]
MDIFLFFIIHLFIGLFLVFFYGKLPKAITTFSVVFFVMSLLYFGVTLLSFYTSV